jgi:alkanesulfonate monooxygenase SsuD/methylene tetrahydromethanopterin reductase-like flavin-dependent oxidoreductase (luciferase family)
MQFDLFHSLGRIDSLRPIPKDQEIFHQFFRQCREGEALGFNTIWVAESHFSSEVQKHSKQPVIPNYSGEVGLNNDSCQLAHKVWSYTKSMGFGTAIFNIVGGNGGPIAAADRLRALNFLNNQESSPRKLYFGIAAGRFPYINAPFGIVPRDRTEQLLWPSYQRFIFLEALEIFLRLSNGEELSSDHIRKFRFDDKARDTLRQNNLPVDTPYAHRWTFESLKLVPELDTPHWLTYVLGSSDPMARDLAFEFADMDLFNLSFTPSAELEKVHTELSAKLSPPRKPWHRSRLPRTVLIFIDNSVKKAQERAEKCFDTYIEAMRGTVQLPDRASLMEKALIGDPETIAEQLQPGARHGFHRDDKLMLWFEFNQVDHDDILRQMKLFAKDVMPRFVS